MEQNYSESFKKIIKGKIEGVDYITIQEKEPRIWHDGEADGFYEFDFTEKEIDARHQNLDIIVGYNGGLYGAFDPNTHTMILTARSDMINVERYKDVSLFIPFSDQKHEPASQIKGAALNYQREISKRKEDYLYGQTWGHFDHSDEIAFLKTMLPSLKTAEEKAKVMHLIEENARYTSTSRGFGKGRNDKKAFSQQGQKFIIPIRESLDKKEIQSLALAHLKWEQNLISNTKSE